MAKRNPQQATSNPHDEPAASPEPKPIQNELEAKKERLAFMNDVQVIMKRTMGRKDIQHREKKAIVLKELIALGTDDDEILYIMSKSKDKPYYGYTFAEMNNLRDVVETAEMLAEIRGSSFASREMTRRQGKPNGHSPAE
jgi:hypothetical protein